MNDDIVAALEAERLGGMPRWNLCPAWLDEAQRRLRAQDHSEVITLLRFNESGPRGVVAPVIEGLTDAKDRLRNAS